MLKMICPDCAILLNMNSDWHNSNLRSTGDICQQCGKNSYLAEVNIVEDSNDKDSR